MTEELAHITRSEDWEKQLFRVVEESSKLPFTRRGNDCCRFVNRCVFAMTGHDLGRQFLTQYRCTRDAVIMLKARTLAWYVTAAIGKTPVDIRRARVGDIVLLPDGEDSMPESVGICVGEKAACMAVDGLRQIPLLRGSKCWQVG